MQSSDVAACFLDEQVAKPVDVEIGVQVGLGQREHPDARELDQWFAVVEELVLEPEQAIPKAAEQRLEVPLLLAGVVEELLSVDQDEGDVGTQQRPERVDAPRQLFVGAGLLLEPLPGIVVPDKTQLVERSRLGGLGVTRVLERQSEGVADRGEAVRGRHPGTVLHAQVVLVEPVALPGIVGEDAEQALLVERQLLGRPVERREEDGLAAAAGAEHGDVLLADPGFCCHGGDASSGAAAYPSLAVRLHPRSVGLLRRRCGPR
ncbi:Uncharacterised protein [Mycobacteroides abscessus]|nr:Uncharacterised protein [Mycobacteroides abscessus]